jgi:cytochrome c oxidase subunit II
VLQADKPGVYVGQCAEFCGHQHAKMRLRLVADPPDVFQAWLAHERGGAPEPVRAQERRGKEVFVAGPCALCHNISGTDASGTNGPDLTHVASRATVGAGTLTNTPEHLRRWVANAQHDKPGNRMPAIPLRPDDLDAVLAYLETLR